MNRREFLGSSMAATMLWALGATSHAEVPLQSFADNLLDIEQLPRFRPVKRVGTFSSYDRTGQDDDGFSGKYSFLRKEGDRLVIAEVSGPGAITRIWTTDPVPDALIEFYFDAETTPRLVLPFKELFSGKTPPFVGSLRGHSLGGYYSYVPLEFAKSIKVAVRADSFHFYQINYIVYEPEVAVRSFDRADLFSMPSATIDGTRLHRLHKLGAGETITLFETSHPGRIQSLRIKPAEAFAGKAKDIAIRMYWDGSKRPAVEAPVADLFGYSFGQPATQSLLLGTEDCWNYIRFPMPFERSARIELISERHGGEPLQVESEIAVSNRGKMLNEGTFHVEWRRENPTIDGQPFTYLDVAGRGHVVATILQCQGRDPGQTSFFEGNDQARIDGEATVHGTGSEDSFNGGWYDIPGRWRGADSHPFSGCLEYNKAIARTGGYRLYIPDAYSFHRSLQYTIEHSGQGNNIVADYTGTSFYYLDSPEGKSTPLPTAAARAVIDPERFVLAFSPSPPPIAALMNGSLDLIMTKLPGDHAEPISFASFKRNLVSSLADLPPKDAEEIAHEIEDQENMFGPPVLVLSVDLPSGGDYSITVNGLAGPSGAMLQLRMNDEPIGNVVDFFAAKRGRIEAQKLGDLHLRDGKNLIYLTIPGKNPQSVGASVDLISIEGRSASPRVQPARLRFPWSRYSLASSAIGSSKLPTVNQPIGCLRALG